MSDEHGQTFPSIELSGSYESVDTGKTLVVSRVVLFKVVKDKDFFVARNNDLGIHAVSRDLAVLKDELIEELVFILQFVPDKPHAKKAATLFAVLE